MAIYCTCKECGDEYQPATEADENLCLCPGCRGVLDNVAADRRGDERMDRERDKKEEAAHE